MTRNRTVDAIGISHEETDEGIMENIKNICIFYKIDTYAV